MPERPEYPTDYVVPLLPFGLNCQVRRRIVPGRGKGRIAAFVIQLEIEIDGRFYPMVRYDCAHDQPHRDILDATGRVIDKQWLPYDYSRALDHAERDIRANWRQYREDFLGRMP